MTACRHKHCESREIRNFRIRYALQAWSASVAPKALR